MEKKFNIGCHLSSSDGYLAMGKQIIKMGGNTFQFFTRNPRGGKAKELDLDDINLYNQYAKENGIDFIVAHAPYTMNLCSDREDIREFALSLMKDDIMKLQHVNNVYYNFHPGSHVGQGVEQGIEYITNALKCGAKGYILKQDYEGIVPAVMAVNLGHSVFGGEVVNKMPAVTEKSDINEKLEKAGITSKEYEVIKLVAEGMSNKEIAAELFLGEGTVRNYLSSILDKLDLRDRTQLVVYYYKNS